MKNTSKALWALPLAAAFAGCSSQPKPEPLTPQAFISPRENIRGSDNPNTGGGSPGDNATPAVQLPENQVTNTLNHALNNAAAVPGHLLSPTARSDTPTPADPSPKTPAANPPAPPTRPVLGESSGQYMTLGGIAAEVNGTPIYATKIIAFLDRPLREKAKQLDMQNYQRQALDLIRKTRMNFVQEELAYAAAQKNLDPDDRRLAEAATMMWRIRQITQAGGSLELARRAAMNDPDQPMDFDEKTEQQSRRQLIELYYQKKIFPKLQVSAADIREYYAHNIDKEFTTNDEVSFRLLKVEIEKTGGKAAALTKITEKWKRAKAGEDFTAMARRENDETMFAGEKPFDIAPASFSIAPVREALTKLKVGEVSDILEDRGAFYIVKIEKRVEGRVTPFEESGVQERIRNRLKQMQYAALMDQAQQKLLKEAIVLVTPEMEAITLDMAMQRYAQYAKAK